jgi:threonine dehydrogenase-like Zn-dependent dehydrogenase
MFAVAFARDMGASAIVVIGGTEERLDLSREFGATTLLNRQRTTVKERAAAVLDLTEGRGADLVIEAVGLPSAYREGLGLVRRGGAYVSIGVGTPVGSVELDLYRDIVFKNLRLQGVWVSHTRHTGMALQLMRKYPAEFSRLVTHRFLLEEATKALETVEAKQAVKAVLVSYSC